MPTALQELIERYDRYLERMYIEQELQYRRNLNFHQGRQFTIPLQFNCNVEPEVNYEETED